MHSILLSGALFGLSLASPTKSSLPVVDLGYELHQAYSYNESAGFYNFSNVRYAAPATGNLRFRAPEAPAVDRSQVQTGSAGKICPQAFPSWSAIQDTFILDYLTGQPFNASAASSSSGGSTTPTLDPRTSEDCLFLDILVPKKVFDAARQPYGYSQRNLAPVMVWIYGGGYTEGDKSTYNGAGFLRTSNNGVIFVALNYRLGAFGWLSGPTFQSDGTANAGLYDQRFALEWVQKYIHLFGGDRDRVLIFGESAGGGSVMHQVTAFGGQRGPVPFQAALPQSPGFLPTVSSTLQENTFQSFLALLNVSTVEEARQLPSSKLITANLIQIANSPYGQFTYGPVVDGIFAPALPGQLLLYGAFDHSVRIMTGHNADEGLDFTPYYDTNTSATVDGLRVDFPGISTESVDFITNTLYPAVFDGSQPYHDEISRAALVTSELAFICNDNYLARAFKNHMFAYKFAIPPALHGQDVVYTFYNGQGATGGVEGVENVTVAEVMQEFITSFAITGRPSSSTWGQSFPEYGPEANIVTLNLTSIEVQKDDTANPRCYWWQKGLVY